MRRARPQTPTEIRLTEVHEDSDLVLHQMRPQVLPTAISWTLYRRWSSRRSATNRPATSGRLTSVLGSKLRTPKTRLTGAHEENDPTQLRMRRRVPPKAPSTTPYRRWSSRRSATNRPATSGLTSVLGVKLRMPTKIPPTGVR